jgi:serine/threonine protein kinase
LNDRVSIPGYRVVRPLATGGMGAVFEVEKLATRQRFAAKFLHEHLATEREYRLRFEREVGALCAVRHPHIVNIFGWRLPGIGEGGKPYILMELLHGEGLDQLLAREVALPPRRAISIMLQALDGLTAAHNAGVIHRDLGPSNVFLTTQPHSDPLVKLLDFGLAGPVGGGEARTNVTQAGTVMGKPAYVAPEMFEAKNIDSRSDIFACGVLLFRMIAGRLPYREQESSLLWIERYSERQAPRPYPALHDILANVPECLDEACSRAMKRSPDERFRSSREMQLALLDVDTELGRLSGETSESLSWSEGFPPDRPVQGAVPGAASTVAFPISPDLDEPLKPKGEETPLPASIERPPVMRLPSPVAGRDPPVVIEPRRPARKKDEQVRVSTAWEVVPSQRPASTPPPSDSTPRRAERSASSVIARSVPAGGRSFVLRPAVLAACVVLLSLTVALVVLFSRPADTAGPTTPATAEAPNHPLLGLPSVDPGNRIPSPTADAAPTIPPAVPPTIPPAVPPTTPPAVPPLAPPATPSPPADAAADAAAPVAPQAPATAKIVLLGLPAGTAASLGGLPFGGSPLEIVVPRSNATLLLRVAAPGFELYEGRLAPAADTSVSIPLVALTTSATVTPPEQREGTGPHHNPSHGGSSGGRDAATTTPTTGGTGLPLPETPPW